MATLLVAALSAAAVAGPSAAAKRLRRSAPPGRTAALLGAGAEHRDLASAAPAAVLPASPALSASTGAPAGPPRERWQVRLVVRSEGEEESPNFAVVSDIKSQIVAPVFRGKAFKKFVETYKPAEPLAEPTGLGEAEPLKPLTKQQVEALTKAVKAAASPTASKPAPAVSQAAPSPASAPTPEPPSNADLAAPRAEPLQRATDAEGNPVECTGADCLVSSGGAPVFAPMPESAAAPSKR